MRLTLDRLCKSFGEKTVINEMSHVFPENGAVWVKGASGSGKTTLLRLIAGLEIPDSGAVLMPESSRLSMVFQEDRLLPTLDARGNILAVLDGQTPENIALADKCLEGCGLKGEERRFPAQLSGGMRRRVAIARAIAYGGDLLLLDEPFKGLDQAFKEQVMAFVFEQMRGGLTLLVTHDSGEASQCRDVLSLE